MHSYVITGIRMGPFARLLRKHGFTPSLKNIFRILFILQNSFWASFFAWRERRIYREKIDNFPVPDDPVIIIGHWRTGSTLLHNLLALDPRFVAPSLFQVTFPEGFLVADRYFRPIMGKVLRHRPMDKVELGFDDPQEDEFALLKLTGHSPLLKLIFPVKNEYAILNRESYIPSRKEERQQWQRQFLDYCRRIRRDSGKRLLLKNPMHSLRIPLLLETFPNARFIYIHRDPCMVVASSLHLWKIMAKDNQLKGRCFFPGIEEVTDGLGLFYQVIEEELNKLDRSQYCTVTYEDLDANPVKEVRKVYQSFGLDFTPETENRIGRYREQTKHFRKNSYIFGEDEKQFVRQRLASRIEQYHYTDHA